MQQRNISWQFRLCSRMIRWNPSCVCVCVCVCVHCVSIHVCEVALRKRNIPGKNHIFICLPKLWLTIHQKSAALANCCPREERLGKQKAARKATDQEFQ